jgi:hypothetical protein
MLRPKLIKNGASGIGHISSVIAVAYLIFGWSRPAFAVEPTAAPEEQSHLQLAPINLSHSVGGYVGYVFQRNTVGSNITTLQSPGAGVTATANIRSFFWQPWFALVSGNLSLNINGNSTHTNTTPTYTTLNTSINGDAVLNVLKKSRFPFEARIFRHQDKYVAFYSGTNTENQLSGYGLQQGYTSQNRRLVSNASYTYNKSGGPNIFTDYMDSFNIDVRYLLTQYQTIALAGTLNKDYTPALGRDWSYSTVVVNHGYQPNSIFSVASFANLVNMNSSLTQVFVTQQYDSNALQFSSFASLRPERTPLTMTSSVRFLRFDSSKNSLSAPTLEDSNFNLGANYLFSPLIRMYGSVNVEDRLGIQTVKTDSALTAAKLYKSSTNIGGFFYSGSIGGTLASSNKTTSGGANLSTSLRTQNLGLYLSHALDKSNKSGGGMVSKNLHQTLTTTVGNSGLTYSTLGTGGYLSWTQVQGKESSVLRVGASDSRNLGGTTHVFQMINLQATRSEAMSNNESLSGNLSAQATREVVPGRYVPNTITPTAGMRYSNKRAFKVLHLTFDSILRIADTNIAPSQPQGYRDQATRYWDNNFAYYIGRLNLYLETRVALIGNTTQSSVTFRMVRPF